MQTKSLCPECKKVIDATVYEENWQIRLKNTHDLLRSAYTVDEKLLARPAATVAPVIA